MTTSTEADEALIRMLASILHESDLSEIEIEKEGVKVRVVRQLTLAPAVPAAAPVAAPAPQPDMTVSAPPERVQDLAQHPGAVKSPMVGTAYLSPEPGTRPFVEIGDLVDVNQTVIIVEAMKTMNQIAAPRAGRVVAILVSDGQPVEYGEPLLVIE